MYGLYCTHSQYLITVVITLTSNTLLFVLVTIHTGIYFVLLEFYFVSFHFFQGRNWIWSLYWKYQQGHYFIFIFLSLWGVINFAFFRLSVAQEKCPA